MKLMCALLGTGLLFAGCTNADENSIESAIGNSETNNLPRHFPTNDANNKAGGGGGGSLLVNHGGPTITNAHVVPIFWGPSWSAGDAGVASSIVKYVGAFGTSGEYNTITQYSGIQKSNLAGGHAAVYDSSTPPTNASDAAIQSEVAKIVGQVGYDPNAIYEVFLPSTSYSSDGSSTSCGGPNLAYCAYHYNYSSSQGDVRYASMPYPSCGGCQTSGFSITQNFEHFISHETREAVTDAQGTAWFDRRGNEADDKCAWSPSPFGDSSVGTNGDGTAFAFQYEWSNANSGCIKTR